MKREVDNEALYDICRRNLDIERPTYTNLPAQRGIGFCALGSGLFVKRSK
jgi:hypothetical protein